tara:strand:- start:128 stop:286 length:159 start_codon:yes stop_codon:yes gene_type:complete
MSYFLEAIKEKIWPSFINRKDKYKWLGVHSMKDPNPNHKQFTIVKKKKSQSN